MKRAAKAIALVLAVFLSSGCSSSPKPANQPQAKTECDEVKKIYEDITSSLNKSQDTGDTVRRFYLIRSYYLLENQKCFTSIQIAAARADIILATR